MHGPGQPDHDRLAHDERRGTFGIVVLWLACVSAFAACPGLRRMCCPPFLSFLLPDVTCPCKLGAKGMLQAASCHGCQPVTCLLLPRHPTPKDMPHNYVSGRAVPQDAGNSAALVESSLPTLMQKALIPCGSVAMVQSARYSNTVFCSPAVRACLRARWACFPSLHTQAAEGSRPAHPVPVPFCFTCPCAS